MMLPQIRTSLLRLTCICHRWAPYTQCCTRSRCWCRFLQTHVHVHTRKQTHMDQTNIQDHYFLLQYLYLSSKNHIINEGKRGKAPRFVFGPVIFTKCLRSKQKKVSVKYYSCMPMCVCVRSIMCVHARLCVFVHLHVCFPVRKSQRVLRKEAAQTCRRHGVGRTCCACCGPRCVLVFACLARRARAAVWPREPSVAWRRRCNWKSVRERKRRWSLVTRDL